MRANQFAADPEALDWRKVPKSLGGNGPEKSPDGEKLKLPKLGPVK